MNQRGSKPAELIAKHMDALMKVVVVVVVVVGGGGGCGGTCLPLGTCLPGLSVGRGPCLHGR